MITNNEIRIEKTDILKLVTSETANKSITAPSQYNAEQDEILRAEFSMNSEDSFWYNSFFKQACVDCLEHVKPLIKYNTKKQTFDSSTGDAAFYLRYEQEISDADAILKEKIRKYIASRITLLWYLSKNLTQLSEPYAVINAACAKELNVLASSIWNNSNTISFYESSNT